MHHSFYHSLSYSDQMFILKYPFDGLVRDSSIFIANALETLQSCIEPLSYSLHGLQRFLYDI